MSKSKEEKYQEWLERMEIPIEETTDIRRFQQWLTDEIDATELQKEVLWEANKIKWEQISPREAKAVEYEFDWGKVIRWYIKGYRGAFGYEKMKELLGLG